jgi:hypothetical protein
LGKDGTHGRTSGVRVGYGRLWGWRGGGVRTGSCVEPAAAPGVQTRGRGFLREDGLPAVGTQPPHGMAFRNAGLQVQVGLTGSDARVKAESLSQISGLAVPACRTGPDVCRLWLCSG